ERAPTIDDARRVAAEALEGRVDHTTVEHTTVEHTAEVQPEAPSSEIDNIETGVTVEQLAAATDYVARTTKRPHQVNITTSSPTNADKLERMRERKFGRARPQKRRYTNTRKNFSAIAGDSITVA